MRACLDDNEADFRIETPEIRGIARNDSLTGASRAEDDVRIHDIARCRSRQHESDSSCIWCVQRDKVGISLPDQAGQASLPRRIPDRLRERGCGNGDPHPSLFGSRQEREDTAIVAVEGDQAASIESDAAHAAFPR
jgi:hypothetical protein